MEQQGDIGRPKPSRSRVLRFGPAYLRLQRWSLGPGAILLAAALFFYILLA